MRIAKVEGLDNDKRGVLTRLIGRGCVAVISISCQITHPTGSPPIPSSSVDSNLLSPPASSPVPPSVFYSQSTPNRPVTQMRPSRFPTSTPISNKTSANHSYASETQDRYSANYHIAQETDGCFLGPMPPQQFLKRFLPIGKGTPQCQNWKGAFESVSSAGKEIDIYALFVSGILRVCT